MAAPRPDDGMVDVPSSLILSLVDGVPPVENKPTPFWKQPAIYVTALLMPLVYIVVIMVLLPRNNYSLETKATVIMAVLGVLAAITGFWLASSWGSSKKDDTLAAVVKAPAPTDPASKP